MRRRRLLAQLDRLDGRSQGTAVMIELGLCASKADYERAFATAWSQVPDGAVVSCWLRGLTAHEYEEMVAGRLIQPRVEGIYLKPLRRITEVAGGEGRQNQRRDPVD